MSCRFVAKRPRTARSGMRFRDLGTCVEGRSDMIYVGTTRSKAQCEMSVRWIYDELGAFTEAFKLRELAHHQDRPSVLSSLRSAQKHYEEPLCCLVTPTGAQSSAFSRACILFAPYGSTKEGLNSWT